MEESSWWYVVACWVNVSSASPVEEGVVRHRIASEAEERRRVMSESIEVRSWIADAAVGLVGVVMAVVCEAVGRKEYEKAEGCGLPGERVKSPLQTRFPLRCRRVTIPNHEFSNAHSLAEFFPFPRYDTIQDTCAVTRR